jgi:hypothetical protein
LIHIYPYSLCRRRVPLRLIFLDLSSAPTTTNPKDHLREKSNHNAVLPQSQQKDRQAFDIKSRQRAGRKQRNPFPPHLTIKAKLPPSRSHQQQSPQQQAPSLKQQHGNPKTVLSHQQPLLSLHRVLSPTPRPGKQRTAPSLSTQKSTSKLARCRKLRFGKLRIAPSRH